MDQFVDKHNWLIEKFRRPFLMLDNALQTAQLTPRLGELTLFIDDVIFARGVMSPQVPVFAPPSGARRLRPGVFAQ
jgi:hypothetical protein